MIKLNELASRRGIKPYEFDAFMKQDESAHYCSIWFGSASGLHPDRKKQVQKMFESLGVEDHHTLNILRANILDTIDRAMLRSAAPSVGR
jgi:hypothetical protein